MLLLWYGLCLFLALLVPVVLLRAVFAAARQQSPKLPSGPWQQPIIGSLHHLLSRLPHRTMRDLSCRHGPLMLLRVCERVVVVVSSVEALREIHKDHDAAFSERPGSPCVDELSRYGQGIIFAPYGDHWRLLRRNLMTEVLTARRVEAFRSIREDEAARLVSSVRTKSSANGGQIVNIDDLIGVFVSNAAGRAIFGDRLPESAALLEFVSKGVNLSSREEDVYGAGVGLETTTTALQWAMSELMINPRAMQKAQSETRRVLLAGLQERINEEAITGLHYMRAVIKETLRLHPPAPFVPRLCLQDSKIQGYDVPPGVITLTNVWAISRDPRFWEEPDKFMPERFQDENAYDFKGAEFEFTPFGAGRRMCPGINFAHKNAEIALASLLYHFDWELPTGVQPEDVDMEEKFGLTLRRKAPLFLRPVPRTF